MVMVMMMIVVLTRRAGLGNRVSSRDRNCRDSWDFPHWRRLGYRLLQWNTTLSAELICHRIVPAAGGANGAFYWFGIGLCGKRFFCIRIHGDPLNCLHGSGNGFLSRRGPAHVVLQPGKEIFNRGVVQRFSLRALSRSITRLPKGFFVIHGIVRQARPF